jgi:hypothetical protein
MDKNHLLASLLRDLSDRVGAVDREKIEDALEDVSLHLLLPLTFCSVNH